jgi:hypothetical protein
MKASDKPKRPRRPKTIEPIHVEELLAGAGMNGFLGVLETPVRNVHLEKLARGVDTSSTEPRRYSAAPKVGGNVLEWNAPSPVRVYHRAGLPDERAALQAPSEISARVASAVLKVEALAERIEAKAKSYYSEQKVEALRISLNMQSEGGEDSK